MSNESSESPEEREFRREFGRRLAEALLQNEQRQQSRMSNDSYDDPSDCDVRAAEAYRMLCYDDPLLESDSDCAALSAALMRSFAEDSVSPRALGLSSRFVQGLLQGCRKQHSTKADSSILSSSSSLSKTSHQQSSVTAYGYAHVAFTVFVDGLQRACREIIQAFDVSNDSNYSLNFTAPHTLAFLGSFTNSDFQEIKTALGDNHESTDVDSLAQPDDLAEIFANESDPDDFDYSHTYTSTLCHFQSQHLEAFDPTQLSRSPTFTSPTESLKDSLLKLLTLVQLLAYPMLAPLNSLQWTHLKVSQTISQLVLHLIQLQRISSTPKQADPYDYIQSMQLLGSTYILPLQIFRERSLDPTHSFDTMNDYTCLLLTLAQQYDSNKIQAVAFSAFLDLSSSFQRKLLLDGPQQSTEISKSFTKKSFILRDAILSTYHILRSTFRIIIHALAESSMTTVQSHESTLDSIVRQCHLSFLLSHMVQTQDQVSWTIAASNSADSWDIEIDRTAMNLRNTNEGNDEKPIIPYMFQDMDQRLARVAVKYLLQILDQTTSTIRPESSQNLSLRRSTVVLTKVHKNNHND